MLILTIQIQDLKRVMEVFSIGQRPARTQEEALQKPYQFWSTQPVPKMGNLILRTVLAQPLLVRHIFLNSLILCVDEKVMENTAIEPDIPIDAIKPEPYTLPTGFQWDTLNIDDPLILKELYTLLNENYVEDEDAMFRFDYPPNFLKW